MPGSGHRLLSILLLLTGTVFILLYPVPPSTQIYTGIYRP